MSETITANFLIDQRGVARELGAFVVAARFPATAAPRRSRWAMARVRLVRSGRPRTGASVAVHDGAMLALRAGCGRATALSPVAMTARCVASRPTARSARSRASA